MLFLAEYNCDPSHNGIRLSRVRASLEYGPWPASLAETEVASHRGVSSETGRSDSSQKLSIALDSVGNRRRPLPTLTHGNHVTEPPLNAGFERGIFLQTLDSAYKPKAQVPRSQWLHPVFSASA